MMPKQKQVLDFCTSYIASQGIAPTLAEIAKYMRVKSQNGIIKKLDWLEGNGYITRKKRTPRSIEIVNREAPYSIDVPLPFGQKNNAEPRCIKSSRHIAFRVPNTVDSI